MDFKKIIGQIEASSEFKEWRKGHAKAYLAHAFLMKDAKGNGEWQVGYFNPKNELMTTAIIIDGKVDLKEDEVFKKPDAVVGMLKLDEVKIGYEKVKESAEEFRKKDYKQELPMKIITVLQNLTEYGTVWNITYVTMRMNTLNLKIDASTGEIKHHELTSLMQFKSSK